MRRWYLRLSLLLVLTFGALTIGLGGAQLVAAKSTIVNAANGKCLDMTNGSTSNGAQPQIWTCNDNPQQFWNFISIGSPFFLIQNANSGKCLSILNNSTARSATVIQWTCNFSGNDLWEDWRQSRPSSPFEFFNAGNPYVMHPSGCGDSNGLKIFMNVSNQCPEDYWS